MTALERVADAAGVELFDHQVDALGRAIGNAGRERLCLYHRTGAGKTLTSLLAVAQWGWDACVVVAPPSTHRQWEELGLRVGVKVEAMSHAKFRMKTTRLSRHTPLIADEMHMFGGHSGQGWKRLEALAKGLDAPLVMGSATPNYNDAERVYCIQRILDPLSCKGGYIEFLYKHCTTEQNQYGREPIVTGFHHFADAEEYLAALPGVAYLPDELVWSITDVPFNTPVPWAYEVFGYDERRHKMVASDMEDRHTRCFMARVHVDGFIHPHVMAPVLDLIEDSPTPVMVYCNHSTIAESFARSLVKVKGPTFVIVTGDTSKKMKEDFVEQFKEGKRDVLIGTATLATGTDGIDKMCDRLIILDDTDDDSLRRQLVGRIMPRGADSDASMKQVYRMVEL